MKDETVTDAFTSLVKIDVKPAKDIAIDSITSLLSLTYTIKDDGTIKNYYSNMPALDFKAEAVENVAEVTENA